MATATVRARSWAEMPVVTPSRASIETVKAVSCREEFDAAISGSPSASSRSPGSVRQMSPRPCVAMKLTAFGVHICAGMTRSPSFSRSSWSTRMNIRPLRASSMISSIEEIASTNSDLGRLGIPASRALASGGRYRSRRRNARRLGFPTRQVARRTDQASLRAVRKRVGL